MNNTLALIKPDAMQKGFKDEIRKDIMDNGFIIAEEKTLHLSVEQAEGFYSIHKDKPFFEELVEFMTSSETHIMKLEKANAVSEWRNLMGATNPAEAEAGTIRAKYGTDISMNATHGSDSNENAEIEINFFSKFYVEIYNNIFFSSTLFSQVQTESWLDYVIEENKEEISETLLKLDNEFYYTIKLLLKKLLMKQWRLFKH